MRDKQTPRDVCGEARLNPDFGSQKKCSFSLFFNRGNKYKDDANIFSRPNFVSPEGRCPLNGGVPKEKFHCM